jgi:unsaturated rhamnogalacturonyl hydrolase
MRNQRFAPGRTLPALLIGLSAVLASHHASAAAAGAQSAAAAQAPAQTPAQAPAPATVLAAMERVADWQLEHPGEHEPTHWARGVADAGFMALANLSGKRRYRDAMVEMGVRGGWKLGPRPYHADDHVIGQTWAELYLQLRQPEMLAPLRAQFDAILADPHEGTLQFTEPGNQDRWSWCDALFMGPPAWMRLYAATGDQRYLEHAVAQWWKTSDYLYDKTEHLYYRDSNYFGQREANGAKVFWARGNGWVMAGLARTLQYLPMNHPARPRFETQFREMAARVVTLQQKDGLWRASLLDPASYPMQETSGTGLFAYALAWGVNQGLLDRAAYAPAVRRAWDALLAKVQPDGKLTHVQPIGRAPGAFAEDATEAYGAGAFLMAGSEIYRMALLQGVTPQSVSVANKANFHRADESIEVKAPATPVAVMEASTSRILPSQRIGDTLLFQANFAPGEQRRFLLLPAGAMPPLPAPDVKVHARFVPERLDDFAWESDRIAHRTYGPAILKEPKEHVSSGIDVWVKSVRYPVLDKWYRQGAYHLDHGEGVDNYHVGTARGCGGLSVFDGGRAYDSKVYAGWKLIADGPLRAVFELRYDAWNAGARQVAETKRISIDAGSNFSRVESRFDSERPAALEVGPGISLRKGEGRLVKDEAAGWISYWEPEAPPHGHTACALVVPGQPVRSVEAGGNALLLGHALPAQPFVHYLGAGWSKSGDFPTVESWEAYVRHYAERLSSPLQVTYQPLP